MKGTLVYRQWKRRLSPIFSGFPAFKKYLHVCADFEKGIRHRRDWKSAEHPHEFRGKKSVSLRTAKLKAGSRCLQALLQYKKARRLPGGLTDSMTSRNTSFFLYLMPSDRHGHGIGDGGRGVWGAPVSQLVSLLGDVPGRVTCTHINTRQQQTQQQPLDRLPQITRVDRLIRPIIYYLALRLSASSADACARLKK